jgi:hypothetical protein
MEAVDELEAQCDQQGKGQQHIGPDADDGHIAQIRRHMETDVAQTARQRQNEEHNACPARRLLYLAVEQGGARRHGFN